MDLLYRILIYTHVISSIGSIGPFFILFPIINKLAIVEESILNAYIDTFRSVVRFTKHAGHVLVGSGILLVISGPWTWKTSWIIMTLFIMLISVFFLAKAFSTTLSKIQEEGQDKDALVSKLKHTLWNYIMLLLAMLWFMVAKPVLW